MLLRELCVISLPVSQPHLIINALVSYVTNVEIKIHKIDIVIYDDFSQKICNNEFIIFF